MNITTFTRQGACRYVLASVFAISLVGQLHGEAEKVSGVEGLVLRPSGAFTFDGLEVELIHFTPEWAGAPQGHARVEEGYPRKEAGGWETRARLGIRGNESPLMIKERLEEIDGNTFRADYLVENEGGMATKELALQVTLPLEVAVGRALAANGDEIVLPTVFSRRQIFVDPMTKEQVLVLPSATGSVEIRGDFSFLVQDQRQWKQDGGYSLRMRFVLPEESLRKAELKVTLRHAPWRSEPVSLRGQANRSFVDETANDGKGGWTDQGAVNDLAAMKGGELNAAGVRFEILDAGENEGRSAVVLGRSAEDGLPKATTVPVPGKPVWRNLYLLHAGAWLPKDGSPVGLLRIRYVDGVESVYQVEAGKDVGNWWSPTSLTNGTVGWTGVNASCPLVGLYVSRFALEERAVAEITLESGGTAMWMVAGISGSPDDLKPFQPQVPFEAKAGPEWAPYDYSLEIEPGGVFDFSFLSDAPAGKYGVLQVTPEGHFEFAGQPGKRVRFWGVNLCFSANYLEPDEAEKLAARLTASGYNTVRIHHYDRDLMMKDKPSEIDPRQLDKLDALFAALKRHGLYINIDLYTARKFSEEEMASLGIDPNGEIAAQFKALAPISEEAFDIWKRFARSLLTHKNPYTGLTWAEDPALIGICPINEDPIDVWIGRAPAAKKLYEKAFAAWWDEAGNREKAGDDRAAGFTMFLCGKQSESDAKRREFLHSLGVKALITGVNFHSEQALTFVREHYDYVDNHQYWDHPDFPEKKWSLPFRFSQRSAVQSAALAPRDLMAARLWGKPYMITEFNFVRPNRYRAEGGVFMPAYASLQDWDGLYNFDYASHRTSVLGGGTAGTFSISNDPIGMLADRVSAVLFRRGDIAAGKRAIGYVVRTPNAYGAEERNFPPAFSRIGLISRIGSGTAAPARELAKHHLDAVVVGASTPKTEIAGDRIFRADKSMIPELEAAGVLPQGSTDEGETRFVSDTGEIELRATEGAMKVVSPRSELFVLPEGQELDGDRVSVKNGKTFGTVSVIAVDGKALEESERLLVVHLTDALASGMKFANQDRRLLESRGQQPHLIQAGSVEVRLRLAPAKSWRAWVVDATGKREREVPLENKDGVWVLQAETVSGKNVSLAYEIAPRARE